MSATYYEFVDAAEAGNLKQLKSIMDENPVISGLACKKAFKLAAIYDHVPVLKWLKTVFEPSMKTLNKTIAYSAVSGGYNAIKWILTNFDYKDISTLDFISCCKFGYTDIMKLFLQEEYDLVLSSEDIKEAFTIAAFNGQLKVLKFLVDLEPDVESVKTICFIKAAGNGFLETAQWLFENYHPDPNAEEEYALRFAAYGGHQKTVKWLLRFNPDIHAKNNFCFKYSIANGHLETLKLLLEAAPSIDKNSLIETAKNYKKDEILKFLTTKNNL